MIDVFNPSEQIVPQAVGVTSAPTTTSTSFVVIPEMTITFTPRGLIQRIWFNIDVNTQSADSWNLALFLDGVEIAGSRRHIEEQDPAGLLGTPGSIPGHTITTIHQYSNTLSSGQHTIDARWAVTAGAARAVLTQRTLIIQDIF